jgi:hypothetical protein
MIDAVSRAARRRTAARALAVAALLALIAWGLETALPTGELRDYGSFVASGRAAGEGKNPYGIHPLTFHVVLPGFDVWNPNLNPPLSIPLFQAFDRVEPRRGFRIWWSVSLICYVAALVLLARGQGARPVGLLSLWALAHAGLWDTLALGQIYLPIVLAVAGSWLLLQHGHLRTAGILIGIVVALKPNLAVWPALLLAAGHHRAALSAAGSFVVLWLLPVMTYGWTIYRQWFELILSDRDRAAFLTNVSLIGLADRAVGRGTGIVLSVALVAALAVWALRTRPGPLRASALGILGGILASPIAWLHYTLFLLPVFFTFRMTRAMVAAAILFLLPVSVLLRLTDAPLWLQVTIGSAYNWAALLCLFGMATQRTARGAHAPTPRGALPDSGFLRADS